MFDPDIIESNRTAQEGLKMLAASGVFEAQAVALQRRLTLGDADATDDALIKEVRRFRHESTVLESLHHQAMQYYKEGE